VRRERAREERRAGRWVFEEEGREGRKERRVSFGSFDPLRQGWFEIWT